MSLEDFRIGDNDTARMCEYQERFGLSPKAAKKLVDEENSYAGVVRRHAEFIRNPRNPQILDDFQITNVLHLVAIEALKAAGASVAELAVGVEASQQ